MLNVIVISGWIAVGIYAAWGLRKRRREREAAEARAMLQAINREVR